MATKEQLAKLTAAKASLVERVATDRANAELASAKLAMSERKLQVATKRLEDASNAKA